MNSLIQNLKNKSLETFFIFSFIFIPMWIVFFINHYIFNEGLNSFGIHSRNLDFISLIQINTPWLLHSGFAHIIGNTSVLFPLILLTCLFETKSYKVIFSLIFISGFFTWLIGSPNSVHVGASGLIFALFGYIFSSLFLGKRFIYIIPVSIVGYLYTQSIVQGLIPTASISLAGHFGGLAGGIVLGYIFSKKIDSNSYKPKRTIKERLDSFVWDIKYKLKK